MDLHQEYIQCDIMYKDEIKKLRKELQRLENDYNNTDNHLNKYFLNNRIIEVKRQIDYYTRKMLR